ncbi:AAA family ATPase [Thermodesulfobacterium sp. TA1]|uniref:Lon protease family protein n=1 Tax=Thermodesulfobacterium sp. TA1 TaxID=2234087 RepID=UPI0012324DF5|nr:ATP-binding protein [Thermodesulfobacterium sp. TA1]QER41802.1 AAA family ATPase [Thermodesulfobacterium sp. TA1]
MGWKKVEKEDLRIKVEFSSGTEDIKPEECYFRQKRVEKTFDLALNIDQEDYNVYVCGPNGIGRSRYTLKRLKEIASSKPTPKDICYVNNFQDPYKPKVLILPSGYGKKFANHIENILEFLKRETFKAFEGKEYEEELNVLTKEIDSQKEKIINQLVEEAKSYNLMVLFGPEGVRLMPLFRVQAPVSQEELLNNPQLREEYHKNLEAFEPKFRDYLRKLRELDNLLGENLLKLRQKIAENLIDKACKPLEEEFSEVEGFQEYLRSLKQELVKNIQIFIDWEKLKGNVMIQNNINRALNMFRVNVLVDNSQTQGAPVIYERIPTLKGLFGQINYKAEMGILYADHLSLAPGILHKANGGYVILDLWEVLKNPYVWILLKRTLLHKELHLMGGMIEEIPVPHIGILPEPVPFSAKVFLIGDPYLYQLLMFYDPEFPQLFKLKAEFEPVVSIDEEVISLFPKVVKKIIDEEKLKNLDSSGLSELFRYAVYQAGNRKKINLIIQDLIDLLREANTFSQSQYITEKEIKQAIRERIYRVNIIEEKIRELIKEGKILIEVEGEKVGQVNGLSVYVLGDYSFGRPSRITANVFPGSRGVVNIEREIDMSGPIHSKGVFILSSYFYNRYSTDFPLQFSCTLTFEQAYEPVEGDSASAAELMAILSAVSKIPVKQNLAITGSIDQFGNIQPVGGIKEKIEGFYRVCKVKNFTGNQGVIIPRQNFDNLLLDDEILEEIEKGTFHVYTVETIDDVIELLTGKKAENFHKEVSKGLKKLYELSKEKVKPSKKVSKKKKSKK